MEGEVTALPRSLGVFALTCIGVGATVGAGIFVLTGSVAAEHSGPAVASPSCWRAIVCLLAGLCYAELAAMIPVAGSAYSYAYATLGEGIAWTVGWCLMLEYLFSASLVAISWAGYAQSTLHQMGIDLPAAWLAAPFEVKDAWHIYRTPTILNLPAVLVTAGVHGDPAGGREDLGASEQRHGRGQGDRHPGGRVRGCPLCAYVAVASVHPEEHRHLWRLRLVRRVPGHGYPVFRLHRL